MFNLDQIIVGRADQEGKSSKLGIFLVLAVDAPEIDPFIRGL